MEPAKTKLQLKRNIKKIIDIDDISVDLNDYGNDDVITIILIFFSMIYNIYYMLSVYDIIIF